MTAFLPIRRLNPLQFSKRALFVGAQGSHRGCSATPRPEKHAIPFSPSSVTLELSPLNLSLPKLDDGLLFLPFLSDHLLFLPLPPCRAADSSFSTTPSATTR